MVIKAIALGIIFNNLWIPLKTFNVGIEFTVGKLSPIRFLKF